MRTKVVRASVVVAMAVMLLSAGCASVDPLPVPTVTPTSQPAPTLTPEPDPELIEGGTAGQNRPFFEFTLNGMLERNPEPSSETVVNSLVDAGFDKSAMEVTAATTPVGDRADSILVAVQIDGQCLIGQIIEAELTSQLADVLGTGRCLIGRTVSIDW